jgi:hypothetical protein
MEARLRILDIEAQPDPNDPGAYYGGGAFFGAFDGAYVYEVLFDEQGVFVFDHPPVIPVRIPFDHSEFHTYRMVNPPNSNQISLFIDGQHIITALAGGDVYNSYEWGDGRSLSRNGASVDWDYVRVWKGIPEPSTAVLCLFGFGIATMAVRRRRSKPLSAL